MTGGGGLFLGREDRMGIGPATLFKNYERDHPPVLKK
jgi:hypothetical protein